jgi:lyso-ornithine lipid O-acyltransferase
MDLPPPGPLGRLRAAWRAAVLVVVLAAGLVLHGLARLVEAPLKGARRPLSPWVTQAVCRIAMRTLGIPTVARGRPLSGAGAIVANHSSWLDIFALNAQARVCFVSKDDVAGWPGIGLLARITGTVFIRRRTTEARHHRNLLAERLAGGQLLAFFPEGTSTDACRILPFKSTLFAPFFDPSLPRHLQVQPVTIAFVAPAGCDPRFFGWWGDMAFGPNLWHVLSTGRTGRAEITFHPPLTIDDHTDRKRMAAAAEALVRSAHPFGGRRG